MKTFIVVKEQFEKIHKYENAPETVKYLRYPHRHIFFVNAKIQVFSDDRELEFILCKHSIRDFIEENKDKWPETISCEMIAYEILKFIKEKYGNNRKLFVSVFEDNENGAVVEEE